MSDALLGTVLAGKYRLDAVLGRGGMGVVYAGEHLSMARPVAIKVLLPQSGGSFSREMVERFRREALAAARLEHPNIVRMLEFDAASGMPFIVMERLEGESLETLLARHSALPVARTVAIMMQVLAALSASHHAGIIHRDIKPSNIFLTQVHGVGEVAKLIDFGIAKVLDATTLTQTGSVLGTPLYAAPELLWGERTDPRADVYSVGVTVYHCLTGSLPISAQTLPQLLAAVREKVPLDLRQLAPSVPPNLAALVMGCLQKNPAQRPQTVDQLMALLAPFREGQSMQHAPMVVMAPGQGTVPSAFTPMTSGHTAGPAHPVNAATMAASGASRSWIPLVAGGALLVLGTLGAAVALYLHGMNDGVQVQTPSAATVTSSPSQPLPIEPEPSARPLAPELPRAPATTRSRSAALPSAASQPAPNTSPLPTASAPPSAEAPPSALHKIKKAAYFLNERGNEYPAPEPVIAVISSRHAQVLACGASACFERGHENFYSYYDVNIDAGGKVLSVSDPASAPCMPLLQCLRTSVFSATFPKPSQATHVRVAMTYIRDVSP